MIADVYLRVQIITIVEELPKYVSVTPRAMKREEKGHPCQIGRELESDKE